MADKKEKKHALYLLSPDEDRIVLVHADDVEQHMADGWSKPESPKANGEEWNKEEDMAQQDIAAEFAKQRSEEDAKKAAEEAKELEKSRSDAEKAAKK
jgi:hypothetical protein